MFKHAKIIFLCMLLLLFAACGKKEEPKGNKVYKTETKIQADTKTVPEVICPDGEQEGGGLCYCSNDALKAEEAKSWICYSNFRRCGNKKFCRADGKDWPFMSERQNGKHFCGTTPAPKDIEGMICENGKWECIATKCDCNGESMKKGEHCIVDGILQEEEFRGAGKKGDAIYCNGVKEIPFAGEPESIICKDGKWKCNSQFGFICKDNQWHCGRSESICNGITLDAIASKVDEAMYQCQFGRWICNENECPCYDGKVVRNEICSDPEKDCSQSPIPYADFVKGNTENDYTLPKEMISEEGVFCEEGNCPCGDGFCAQYATCSNGQCQCANLKGNAYGEFICRMYFREPVNEPDPGEAGGLLYCLKEGGCKAPDDRHYFKGAIIGFVGWNDSYAYPEYRFVFDEEKRLAESRMFYLTSLERFKESLSILGECVPPSPLPTTTTLLCLPNLNNGMKTYPNLPGKEASCVEADYYGSIALPIVKGKYQLWGEHKPDQVYDSEDTALKVYDVERCEGGTRYCKGRNNEALKHPGSDYYECRDVVSFPGNDAREGLKAWVCMEESCRCGKGRCTKNQACIDGVCASEGLIPEKLCHGQKLMPGYECGNVYIGIVDERRGEPGGKCVEESCQCGNKVCPKDHYCLGGKCRAPKQQSCFGGKIENGVCLCGEKTLNDDEDCETIDGKEVAVCVNVSGCACGDTICPSSSACVDNVCIDPLSGESLSKFGSDTALSLSLACASESCVCGKNSCRKGQHCFGGRCVDHIHAQIVDGKRVFYSLDFLAINEDMILRDPDNIYKKLNASREALESYVMRVMRFNEQFADNATGYVPTLYFESYDLCCDDMEFRLITDDMHCALSDGCLCGGKKCAYGAGCKNGECVYDYFYKKHLCSTISVYDLKDNPEYHFIELERWVEIGVDGQCLCEGSVRQPSRDASSYACTVMGFVCLGESCVCGDVQCKRNDICVRPGVCRGLGLKDE